MDFQPIRIQFLPRRYSLTVESLGNNGRRVPAPAIEFLRRVCFDTVVKLIASVVKFLKYANINIRGVYLL